MALLMAEGNFLLQQRVCTAYHQGCHNKDEKAIEEKTMDKEMRKKEKKDLGHKRLAVLEKSHCWS